MQRLPVPFVTINTFKLLFDVHVWRKIHLSIDAPTCSLYIIYRFDCNEKVFELFIRCSVSSVLIHLFICWFVCIRFSWLPFVLQHKKKNQFLFFFYPFTKAIGVKRTIYSIYILCGYAALAYICAMVSIAINCKMFNWVDLLLFLLI